MVFLVFVVVIVVVIFAFLRCFCVLQSVLQLLRVSPNKLHNFKRIHNSEIFLQIIPKL